MICCNYVVKNLHWNILPLLSGKNTHAHGRPSNVWVLPNSCWQLSPVIKACVHCRAFSSRPGMSHHSSYWTWISGSLKTTNKIRRMWPRMTSAPEVCVRASVKGVWVEGREYLSVCSCAWRVRQDHLLNMLLPRYNLHYKFPSGRELDVCQPAVGAPTRRGRFSLLSSHISPERPLCTAHTQCTQAHAAAVNFKNTTTNWINPLSLSELRKRYTSHSLWKSSADHYQPNIKLPL